MSYEIRNSKNETEAPIAWGECKTVKLSDKEMEKYRNLPRPKIQAAYEARQNALYRAPEGKHRQRGLEKIL